MRLAVQLAAVFKRAEELGVTMLNSAEFYGADRINEKIIAKHASPALQVSLKVGGIGDLNTGHLDLNATADHLRATVDESLKILGRESIDVIVQVRQDPNTPIEDVMKTFKELVEAGAHCLCARLCFTLAGLLAVHCAVTRRTFSSYHRKQDAAA